MFPDTPLRDFMEVLHISLTGMCMAPAMMDTQLMKVSGGLEIEMKRSLRLMKIMTGSRDVIRKMNLGRDSTTTGHVTTNMHAIQPWC